MIPISATLMFGHLLSLKKPDKKDFFAKEGFIIVGLSWIIMSFFGCLPFIISKEMLETKIKDSAGLQILYHTI